MQQFVVPQFIDVEDKVFGPITVRQFLILLFAGVVIWLGYRFGDFAMFLTILIFVGALALLFGFYKPNGQVFHYFVLNLVLSLRRPGLRIWNNVYTNQELDYLRKLQFQTPTEETVERKQAQRERIRDLSLLVNTGGYYRPEDTEF